MFRVKIMFFLLNSVLIFAGSSSHFIDTYRTDILRLAQPAKQDGFRFAILVNKNTDMINAPSVLEQVIGEINAIHPDFVMTMGHVTGKEGQNLSWIDQVERYKQQLDKLKMPWYPVADNYDVYGVLADVPSNLYAGFYERYWGPLWYAFKYKNCWFIVLYAGQYSDKTALAKHSESGAQVEFLSNILATSKGARHIFVFISSPKSTEEAVNMDWKRIQTLLVDAEHVSVYCLGGQDRIKYNGKIINGIEYYTPAAIGIKVSDQELNFLNGYNLVTVQEGAFHIATIQAGTVINPREKRTRLELLKEKDWVLDKSCTVWMCRVKIPDFQGDRAVLRIGIVDGYDESGDRSVHYTLCNSNNDVIRKGYFAARTYQWIELAVQSSTELRLELRDEDINSKSQALTNSGRVKMELDVYSHINPDHL